MLAFQVKKATNGILPKITVISYRTRVPLHIEQSYFVKFDRSLISPSSYSSDSQSFSLLSLNQLSSKKKYYLQRIIKYKREYNK